MLSRKKSAILFSVIIGVGIGFSSGALKIIPNSGCNDPANTYGDKIYAETPSNFKEGPHGSLTRIILFCNLETIQNGHSYYLINAMDGQLKIHFETGIEMGTFFIDLLFSNNDFFSPNNDFIFVPYVKLYLWDVYYNNIVLTIYLPLDD